MAYKLDFMDLRQILRLRLDGYSNRKIAEQLGISRNTVNTYVNQFANANHSLESLIAMDPEVLDALFPSSTTIKNDRYEQLMRYFDKVNLARNHTGFTFQFHHQEYSELYPKGYGYTQFMEHYHRRFEKIKGSLKLEHEPGKEVYIDFAGKKLKIIDKITGEIQEVEVFVAILPNSHYTYIEACRSQKRADLIGCMEGALQFFGGVPKASVSDNLKSAVSRSSKYEAEINRSFKDFANHYNCVVNPTRSYSPQDKALVENAVHLAYQRVYYPMREMTFFSLEELNQEIRKKLEQYNNLQFQRKEASRKELFQAVERQYLKALPQEPYELKDYRRAKVQKIGYVYFSPDKSYYSVPYRYIGKHTLLHYTQTTVEVYYNHNRIATHHRYPAKGSYNTNKDHLSSTHSFYLQWSPEYFIKLATPLGSNVVNLISAMLAQGDYPEVNYKRAMGVIQLHKSFGAERLNRACQRALMADALSYRRLKNILINKLDQVEMDLDALQNNQPHIPAHSNIRGADYYA